MAKNTNSPAELLENNPEVTSYIYQQISEFEPYITNSTVFAVVAKDPTKLANQDEANLPKMNKKELKKLFRISMSLTENGTTLEAEGVSSDIFTAIKMAREKLSAHLASVHEEMISQKDREQEIENLLATSSSGLIH